MSDREYRNSEYILTWVSKDTLRNKKEREYLHYYKSLTSNLFNLKNSINYAKSNARLLEYRLQKIDLCKFMLSKLETTTPIQTILNREREPLESIPLCYLNIELPDSPNSNVYLTNYDLNNIIRLLTDKTDDLSSNENSERSSVSEVEEENRINEQKAEASQPQKAEGNPKILLLPLILSILFLISIADMPYGFYTFARITVFVLSIIFLYIWYGCTGKFSPKFIPVIIIAILWNPILPIYLDKETWILLDVFASITEIIVGIVAYRDSKKK